MMLLVVSLLIDYPYSSAKELFLAYKKDLFQK